jgi:hypothetical protein
MNHRAGYPSLAPPSPLGGRDELPACMVPVLPLEASMAKNPSKA